MNRRVVWNTIIATALVLLFCSPSAAQTYTVRLKRPSKKGERYRVTGSGFLSQKRTATADGRVVTDETETFSAEFGADETVLELGSDGNVAKETLTINNCLVRRDGTAKQLFPKGTVVMAAVEDGDKVFRINGKPVDKQSKDVLDMMSSLSSTPSKASDDDIFGTGEQRKVGDSWKINSAVAVKSLREEIKLIANQEDTKGTVTIEKKLSVGKEECLLISGTLDIDLITGEMSGIKVDSGDMHARFSGAYPLDISHPIVQRSLEMTMRMRARARPDPSGPEIQVDVKHETKVTTHYTTL